MERELNRYLRLATWGLPEKKKLEIAKELRGNIEMLRLEYMVQGQNSQQALTLALRDFGAPERVCAGMTKVYTMPVFLRNVGLAVLLSSFGVSALFSSSAQVEGTTRMPIPQCLQSNQATVQVENKSLMCESNGSMLFLHLPSLKAILEPLGVSFLSHEINSPGVTTQIYFPGSLGRSVTIRSGAASLRFEGKLFQFDKDYVYAAEFFDSLKNAGLPLTLQGWNNASLSVGVTKFLFGSASKPLGGYSLFSHAVVTLFPEFDQFTQGKTRSPYVARNDVMKPLNTFRLQIPNAKPDDIYVVLTREKMQDASNDMLHVQTLTPNASGKYELSMYAKALNFRGVLPDQLNIGNFDGELEAVLLKFNGRLDLPAKEALTVIDPSQFTVQK